MSSRDWAALTPAEVFMRLGSSSHGLVSAVAAERLRRHGPNIVPARPPASAWRVFAAQFRGVVTLLLAAALAVTLVSGDRADAVAIALVLALNATLGFAMEIRACRAVEALSRLEPRVATVLRDGNPSEIDASRLVPGDLLLLEAGQVVPADARLSAGTDLRLVESTLTGEAAPVSKRPEARVAPGAPLQDLVTMVFAGTVVAAGSGRAAVVETGGSTELGRIGRLVSATRPSPTPLERRLDVLGRQLAWAALGVGAVTGVIAWLQDVPTALVLQTAIALAVAAVPEGLPAVATIALALGVRRMAARSALIRRLPSVETLGAVTVICTDKTGTLTAGAMTVTEMWTAGRVVRVTGEGYSPCGTFQAGGVPIDPALDDDLQLALRIGVMANRAGVVDAGGLWTARGDPTEAALIAAAAKAGIERETLLAAEPEVAEVPFSSERKLMATFHRAGGDLRVYVKGAPTTVLSLCTRIRVAGRDLPMDEAGRDAVLEANGRMGGNALRVLALATRAAGHAGEPALAGLTFVALAGLNDPPAPGVLDAIAAFRSAGIRTVMITGDQRETALAVARELHLPADAAPLDGAEVDAMPDEELARRAAGASLYVRSSPEGKLRIIGALQAAGEIVAMIGDGVNDAAALRKADVGVAMGRRGTDVARETAAVVLQDDRFGTIGAAIEEGRTVFENIRKSVVYLFSCNLAEILVLLGAGVAGMPLPLLPIQILWLNLLTDTFPALALALEPAKPDVMRRPPRPPAERLLSQAGLGATGLEAAVMAGSVGAVMAWAVANELAAPVVMSMNFAALAGAQLFHLGNARDDRPVLAPARVIANRAALAALVGGLVLHGLAMSPLLRTVLHTVPLSGREWTAVALAAVFPAVAGQAARAWRGRNR